MWSLLKNALSKRSKRALGIGNSFLAIKQFIIAIKEEWWKINQKVIDNLILSLPRRYDAIIEAKGWYTKY